MQSGSLWQTAISRPLLLMLLPLVVALFNFSSVSCQQVGSLAEFSIDTNANTNITITKTSQTGGSVARALDTSESGSPFFPFPDTNGEIDFSTLTEQEQLRMLEILAQDSDQNDSLPFDYDPEPNPPDANLTLTEVEMLPQPQALVSHVRKLFQTQEHDQRVLRHKIRNMIIPPKKQRGRVQRPTAIRSKHGHNTPLNNEDRRNEGFKAKRPPPIRHEEVIGHQLPPSSVYPIPSRSDGVEHRRHDKIEDVIETRPAPKPYLIHVPGQGVIKLPPPPSHVLESQSTAVFPPPFPVGAVPAARPPGKHSRPSGRPNRVPSKMAGKKRPRPGQNRKPRPRRPSHHPPPHKDDVIPLHIPAASSDVDGYQVYVVDEDTPGHESEGFFPPHLDEFGFDIDQSLKTTAFPFKPDVFELSNFERIQPEFPGNKRTPVRRPFKPENSERNQLNRFQATNDCSFFTETICLDSNSYPFEAIARSLAAGSPLAETILAEVSSQSADSLVDGVSSNQEQAYDYSHYFGTRRQDTVGSLSGRPQQDGVAAHSHRDFAKEGGYLCPSEVKYGRPMRARNSDGEWKFIVNMQRYTQTLRMEKCLRPGSSCSYVSHHYKSHCSQVFNYHRLLSWHQSKGLHMDIFKVPVACSCHIQGYSYIYPPLETNAISLREASNVRSSVVEAKSGGSVVTPDDQLAPSPPRRVVTVPSPYATVSSGVSRLYPGPTLAPPTAPETEPGAGATVVAPDAEDPPGSQRQDAHSTGVTSTQRPPKVTTRRRHYRNRIRLGGTRRTNLQTRRRSDVDSVNETEDKIDSNDGTHVSSFGKRIDTGGGNQKRGVTGLRDSELAGSQLSSEVLPPSVETGSPLATEATQRARDKINYEYHPIIDFFHHS